MSEPTPQRVITELSRQFYEQGWATGTGGGISVRHDGRVYMAPSGVQKERIAEDDIFELDHEGNVLRSPEKPGLKVSECSSLFYNAYRLRDAGAVLHSHSVHAVMVTLLNRDVFECTELEMIKGLAGHGYYDRVQVFPIARVTCITHRKQPLWYGTMEMVPPFDHNWIALLPVEGELLGDLRRKIPEVNDVAVTPNLAYVVQLNVDGANKPHPEFGKYVLHAVWGAAGRWARTAKRGAPRSGRLLCRTPSGRGSVWCCQVVVRAVMRISA